MMQNIDYVSITVVINIANWNKNNVLIKNILARQKVLIPHKP